ncbi:hypothetical protein, partial [Lacticaseibacillus rhamnosus]|uniref:hypothetical protein n=1 Tax=Lacticaseibacillus rhamnosus TaxID=47715 RepID=UPI001CDC7E2C
FKLHRHYSLYLAAGMVLIVKKTLPGARASTFNFTNLINSRQEAMCALTGGVLSRLVSGFDVMAVFWQLGKGPYTKNSAPVNAL